MKQLTIIGLGLIGGSIALALKQQSFEGRIVACDSHEDSLQAAIASHAVDEATDDVVQAVATADCILIAAPLHTYGTIFKTIQPHLQSHTIVTDAGSAKVSVIDLASHYLAESFPRFVPGHPIAGAEKSGFTAANAGLFQDKLVILTPVAQTALPAVMQVEKLWETIGAHPELMTATQHDEIFSATSHLPQLLVYTYLETLRAQPDFPQLLKYTGTGFKDFTRLGASNPALWADIALHNRNPLLQTLKQFQQRLNQLHDALEAENRALLQKLLRSTPI